MKLMRLAAFVAAFAVVGGIAMAEDADVRALQAKLAAQEARLNDLQAKMYGTECEDPQLVAQGLTSLRKNAVVTIGGVVNTRYHSRNSKLESSIPVGGGTHGTVMRDISKGEMTQFHVSDALLQVKVDVNDYFDAYAQFNFNDNNRDFSTGMAENYWIRWKNVCNSGFGLLVGRDREKHGGIGGMSIYDNWQITQSDSAGGAFAGWNDLPYGNNTVDGEGMFRGSDIMPAHSTHGFGRVTQINPYWESQDGRIKAELSFFKGIEDANVNRDFQRDGYNVRKSINYGLGGESFRLTFVPVEGLTVIGSVKNVYADNDEFAGWNFLEGNGFGATGVEMTDNNTSVFLGFSYTPTFFNRATLWASYMHGWNEAWVQNQDSDSVSFGLNFKLTDQWTAFAAGDWLRVDNEQGNVWSKANGWASDVGLQYALPYGVTAQAGWRHEVMKYEDRAGHEHTKYTADTIYGHLGFAF